MLYYRWYDDKWGVGRRSMARTTSQDLMSWTPSVPMTYGDTPREQFYINNTQLYFRAPLLYIAPAARFMEGRQAITAAQAAAIGVKSIGPHRRRNRPRAAVLSLAPPTRPGAPHSKPVPTGTRPASRGSLRTRWGLNLTWH